MSITIRIDTSAVTKNLNALAQTQLPFAIAKAVTQTGLDFQKAEKARLATIFTLRRPDFIQKQGVKLIGGIATKQRPSITFGVDKKADFLIKFEDGGLKKPRKGPFLSLPTDARRNKKDIITTANRPKALLARLGTKKGAGGVFRIDRQHGKLVPGFYQRTGRGGIGVKLLFAFERDANTPKALHFVDTFKQTVERNWQPNFQKALADAIRTAK